MADLCMKRLSYQPKIPDLLKDLNSLICSETKMAPNSLEIEPFFSKTIGLPFLNFFKGTSKKMDPIRVGVVFSGGQAAGGHNVVCGIYDAITRFHPKSSLFGFLEGPEGIVEQKWMEMDCSIIDRYRNQGGFDLIGSGRTKIETEQQFAGAEKSARELNLDGLVIIGGDDSNTNAAFLAEYFLRVGCKTCVIGVPKTIDGDLRSDDIEISFGFDTATKTYSEIIGNICRDALSSKKYTFFIKLMGRSASHIALECALRTHPNLTFIGEEVEAKGVTFSEIIQDIADMICKRSEEGKEYGVILIPEGLIEFIPEFKQLIKEINLLNLDEIQSNDPLSAVKNQLTQTSFSSFQTIPIELQRQLLQDRDPHGNVNVSKIETERMLIHGVLQELKLRKKAHLFHGKFSAQPLFCGYEGRSCLPSNFDCDYCYSLGLLSALLVREKKSGYMACIKNLSSSVDNWQLMGIPIASMIHLEVRKGKYQPVIKKELVDLKSSAFAKFEKNREKWKFSDDYVYPGPIQFFGPDELTDSRPLTLSR